MKRTKMSKKGAYLWISWVLLFAFAIALSAVMYNWIFGYTESSAEQMTKRADAAECQFVSVNIDSACQNAKNLYMDLSNRNNLNINKVKVRLYNIYGEPIEPLIEKSVIIAPGDTSSIVVSKDGVVARVEVIPMTFTKKYEITCKEKMAVSENIAFEKECV